MSDVVRKAVDWAGEHPVVIAVAVFGVGALFLLSQSGGSSGGSGLAAFAAASAAQTSANAAVQENLDTINGETAIAGIAANQNTTINAQNNATAQQGQKQQFFLATGEQQLQGQAAPFLLQDVGEGGTSAAAAASIWQDFISSGTTYAAAH